jgi:hypothetical protein
MTTNPIERLDVPTKLVQLEARRIRVEAHVASLPEPQFPECLPCGNRKGPLVPDPSGARWPSGAQVFECAGWCTAADPDRHALDSATDRAFAALAANWTPGSPA